MARWPLRPFRLSLAWLAVLFLPAAALAAGALDDRHREFAAEVAAAGGPAEQEVLEVLARAQVRQSILDAIARPAEAKPWKDYRPIFMTDRRIRDGIDFYRANQALLDRVSAQYGVPASVIVAIIGVETNYGGNIGSYRVLDALFTLAFEYPPRAPFFRSELKNLFLLDSKQLAYPLDELTGSYAGAMGWGQFMPSSIAAYAVDGDGDGRIDLWQSLPDIVSSVANYFAEHGWLRDAPVTVRVQAADHARALDLKGLDPVYPVQQMEAWGYVPAESVDGQTLSTLLRLEGANGPEFWLTFQNFYVISRYNRSALYSMAVWQLSQAIAHSSAADAS